MKNVPSVKHITDGTLVSRLYCFMFRLALSRICIGGKKGSPADLDKGNGDLKGTTGEG